MLSQAWPSRQTRQRNKSGDDPASPAVFMQIIITKPEGTHLDVQNIPIIRKVAMRLPNVFDSSQRDYVIVFSEFIRYKAFFDLRKAL